MKNIKLNGFLYSIFLLLYSSFAVAKVTDFIDNSYDPTANFYRHANGLWLKDLANQEVLPCNVEQKIIQDDALFTCLTGGMGNNPVSMLYQSFMNTNSTVPEFTQGIRNLFSIIDNIHDSSEIPRLVGDLNHFGVGREILGISTNKKIIKDSIETEWVATLQPYKVKRSIFKYSSYDSEDDSDDDSPEDISNNARVIHRIFTRIFTNTKLIDGVNLKNVSDIYKYVSTRGEDFKTSKYTKDELRGIMQKYGWDGYFISSGLANSNANSIIANEDFFPSYLTGLNSMFKGKGLDELKVYFKLLVLLEYEKYIPYIGREKDVSSIVYEAFGTDFASMCFNGHIKLYEPEIMDIVEHVKESYRKAFNSTTWKSQTTKTSAIWMNEAIRDKALKKLELIHVEIGTSPDHVDYSTIMYNKKDPIGNLTVMYMAKYKHMLNKIGRHDLVLAEEPRISPATYVNFTNTINIKLTGITPYNFIDPNEYPVNYGSFGAMIAHEIAHAFDDSGREDYTHGLTKWISDEDSKNYFLVSKALEEQYVIHNKVSPKNAIMSSRENMADNLGVRMAYNALQTLLQERSLKGEKELSIDGISANRLFFYGWSQLWRYNNCTPGIHSTDEVRANGPLKNLPEFQKEFGVVPFRGETPDFGENGGEMYIKDPINFSTMP